VTGTPSDGKHEKILDRLEEAPGHAVNGGVGSIQADIAGDHDGAKLQKWRQYLSGLIGDESEVTNPRSG
jgi:hypothetical protein